MQKFLTKTIHQEELTFSNHRAVFWHREKMLILSDLHVGKTAHFRKNGIAVSAQVLHDDLRKLSRLIDSFNPRQIVVVGDLFHAGYNSDLDIFKEYRATLSQDFLLIKGNHDRLSCAAYENLGVECVEEAAKIFPFFFTHKPGSYEGEGVCISGHIHPGYVLEGRNERLRLPCFALSAQQIILPAFSRFTGLDTSLPRRDFDFIVFNEGTIFEV